MLKAGEAGGVSSTWDTIGSTRGKALLPDPVVCPSSKRLLGPCYIPEQVCTMAAAQGVEIQL